MVLNHTIFTSAVPDLSLLVAYDNTAALLVGGVCFAFIIMATPDLMGSRPEHLSWESVTEGNSDSSATALGLWMIYAPGPKTIGGKSWEFKPWQGS